MLVEWSDKLLTGIEEIDEQHKKIVSMLNSIPNMKTKDEIINLTQNFIKLTNEHIKTEEMYLEKYKYPNIKTHQEEHKTIIKKYQDILEYTETSQDKDIIEKTKLRLLGWMQKHHKNDDIKAAAFFRSCIKNIELLNKT